MSSQMQSYDPFQTQTVWPASNYMDPFSDMGSKLVPFNEHPSRSLMNTTRNSISKFQPILHTDIVETANDFSVHCDLPGVNAADLECTVLPDVLIIKAEKKFANREEGNIENKIFNSYLLISCLGDTWYRSERAYGKVQRTLPLPVYKYTSLFLYHNN